MDACECSRLTSELADSNNKPCAKPLGFSLCQTLEPDSRLLPNKRPLYPDSESLMPVLGLALLTQRKPHSYHNDETGMTYGRPVSNSRSTSGVQNEYTRPRSMRSTRRSPSGASDP